MRNEQAFAKLRRNCKLGNGYSRIIETKQNKTKLMKGRMATDQEVEMDMAL